MRELTRTELRSVSGGRALRRLDFHPHFHPNPHHEDQVEIKPVKLRPPRRRLVRVRAVAL